MKSADISHLDLTPHGVRSFAEGADLLWATLSTVVRMPCRERVRRRSKSLLPCKRSTPVPLYRFTCPLGIVTCWWPEGLASPNWCVQLIFFPFDLRDEHVFSRCVQQDRLVHQLWQHMDESLAHLDGCMLRHHTR
jgi:hypothetical protein